MAVDLSELEQHFGLPPGLLSAQIQTESGGDPNAVSPAGAVGLAQFMPATAAQLGIDPTDPDQSKVGMAMYDAQNLQKFGGDVPSALAAYNWGPGAVAKNGIQNAPPETQNYVSKIMGMLNPVGTANAAEVNPYDNMSDDDLIAEAKKQGIPINDMSADVGASSNLPPDQQVNSGAITPLQYGSKPLAQQVGTDIFETDHPQAQPTASNEYDNLSDEQLIAEAKKQGIPTLSPQEVMNKKAQTSVATSLPAQLTAYGANAMHAISNVIPGLPQAGSAIAAAAGYGKGKSFGERYNDLEASQKAMRQAGEENNPGATALGQLSGNVLGAGLAGGLMENLTPNALAQFETYAAANPLKASALSGAGYGALYGFNQGEDTSSRLKGAAEDSALTALASPPIALAMRYIGAPIASKLGEYGGSALSKLADYIGSKGADDGLGAASSDISGEAPSMAQPLETDVSKIDPNTPIKQYENLTPDIEKEQGISGDEVTKSQVNKLQGITQEIAHIKSLNDNSAAGQARLAQLEDDASYWRDQLGLNGKPEPVPAGPGPGYEESQGAQAKASPVSTSTPIAAAPAQGGTVGGIIKNIASKPDETTNPVSNESDIASKVAAQFYQKAQNSGEVLPASFTNQLVSKAETMAPQTLAGKLTTGSSPLEDLVSRWQALKDKPLDMQSVQEMDEGLGNLIDKEYTNGKISKQGKQLLDLQHTFRDMIDQTGSQAGENFSNARLAWKQAMKLRDLERIRDRAELADNPATMIKSGIRTLLSNPNKSRWYSADEITALKQAADRGVLGSVAHVFGFRALPYVTGMMGELVGGPLGAGIGAGLGQVGSATMRKVGTGIQSGRLAQAEKFIASKVPKP